jgi:CRISPR-associated protein Csb1
MSNVTHAVQATIQDLDAWATNADGPVALRLKQALLPVEESGIIFPPTYADIGYNIDTLSDGTRVAAIDSVGSQANRLEPIFKSESNDANDWLVPQIDIVIRKEDCGECESCRKNATQSADTKAKKEEACTQQREVRRSLLDLAHRAADAVVRASPDLLELIAPAFKHLRQGNATPLCVIAPTSLVFGVWDSRGETGEKRPRLVRSIIRAWDVEPLHAAAQFNSVWKLLDEAQKNALEKEAKKEKTDLSEKGLKDAPATFRQTKNVPQYINDAPNPEARVLGGVLVKGRIEREITINLVALRGLRGSSDTETNELRKYLLGLSLLAATTDLELFLREGCLLRYAEEGDAWYQVPRRGEPKLIDLNRRMIEQYVNSTAEPFRKKWPQEFKKWPELKYTFNIDAAKKLLAKKTKEENTQKAD